MKAIKIRHGNKGLSAATRFSPVGKQKERKGWKMERARPDGELIRDGRDEALDIACKSKPAVLLLPPV